MTEKLNRILLVDDDEATNAYNKAMVIAAEVAKDVTISDSGRKALEFLKSEKDGEHPQPAIIFLDINMPGMDGWEFLDEYNQLLNGQKADVVVVMLTTSLDPDDKLKAAELGTKGFLRKPLTPERVQEIVKANFPEKF